MTIQEIKELVNQRIKENYTGDISAEDVNRALNETLDHLELTDTEAAEIKTSLGLKVTELERKSGEIGDSGNDADLDITDESGNVLVKFCDGHIKVKNFDSKECEISTNKRTNLENADDTTYPTTKAVADAIAQGGNSPIIADSENDSDLDLADEYGNIIVRFRHGQVRTKNFNSKSISSDVEMLKQSIGGTIVNPTDGLPSLDDNNPLARISRESGYCSIFKSWGFIGDSMSSGEVYGYLNGTRMVKDDYSVSWGQFICKACHSTGYNYSIGGESAWAWVNGRSGNKDRAWAKAQTQPHDVYTIALGQNDAYNWANNANQAQMFDYPCVTAYPQRSYYLDEGLEITKEKVLADIDLTDFTQNANSYAGWMAGIIQRLKSIRPKCHIFILTNPQKVYPYYYYNQVVKYLVDIFKEQYGNTIWLLDMAEYSRYKVNKDNISLLGLHFSPYGYLWSAWEIMTYIDWIIRHNIKAFEGCAYIEEGWSSTNE